MLDTLYIAIADGVVTNSVFQRNGLGNTVRYKILYNNKGVICTFALI